MSNIKKRIVISICFLLLGVLIYFLFDIGLLTKENLVFSIIRDFLPDLCWILSFFFISIIFMAIIIKHSIIINSIYVFLVSVLYECLQCFNIAKGTFDMLDILNYIISILIACLIEKLIRRKENEKIV